ncbi:unnamed protein product [Linum tenue]|uniref:Ubiquitin-like domain-containing protein n=1 Tax=Linum tenue TaxID=586396 RepID=A0AAV0JL19_9ROSI|nr:unnamed protein product [Linum tenue]
MENHRVADWTAFQIFARLLDGKTATLRFAAPQAYTHEIKRRIFEITRIPVGYQRLVSGGRQLDDDSVVSTPECSVHLLLGLRGGKGGFGSLLRGAATKAGQKKTNNFDACRDMSGRRLRHVNAEKRLEEWKAGEAERRLEKVADDFLKKNAKKNAKKGNGDGEAAKYVAKYREDSAKCVAEVEDAVREAFSNGSGKRKGKFPIKDAKKLKNWLGKKMLGVSDSEDSEDNSESEGTEKSVILNGGSNSDPNSDSVSDWKQNAECSASASGESGREEEKEVAEGHNSKSSSQRDAINDMETVAEPDTCSEVAAHSPTVNGLEVAKASGPDEMTMERREIPCSENVEVTADNLVIGVTNGPGDLKADKEEEIVVAETSNADLEKQLNLEDFTSPTDLEVLGLEKLKTELQARGLKCGGTLQERAARLFLLKSTPVDKLPKKLLAKK